MNLLDSISSPCRTPMICGPSQISVSMLHEVSQFSEWEVVITVDNG